MAVQLTHTGEQVDQAVAKILANFADVSGVTASAGDVAEGKYFVDSNGVLTAGTYAGAGGYRITFISEGSTYATVQVPTGAEIAEPTQPTKQGYFFDGWGATAQATTFQTFPYTPQADATWYAVFSEGGRKTVSGLGSAAPSEITVTTAGNFPTTFEEVLDGFYNVFIKIPTIYRKIEAVTDGQITSYSIRTGPSAGAEPYPVFKYGNTILPYVLIGKYTAGSSSPMTSVADSHASSWSMANARNAAQADGEGYQLYDWQFHKLFQDLAVAILGTVDENNAGTILGITDLKNEMWLDGIGKTGNYYSVCYDPTKYSNDLPATDYEQVAYPVPSANPACVKIIGYDPNHPFVGFAAQTYTNSAYNTYYCAGCYTTASNEMRPVTITPSGTGTSGLFMQATTNVFGGSYRARLCYRPIGEVTQ